VNNFFLRDLRALRVLRGKIPLFRELRASAVNNSLFSSFVPFVVNTKYRRQGNSGAHFRLPKVRPPRGMAAGPGAPGWRRGGLATRTLALRSRVSLKTLNFAEEYAAHTATQGGEAWNSESHVPNVPSPPEP